MINIKDKYRPYYTANEKPELIEVEQASYVSLLGSGSPGTDIFYEKKQAIKQFKEKLELHFKATPKAFQNSIVEIFYWFDEDKVGYIDIGNFYTTVDLSLLHYRIAIRIPDTITAIDLQTFIGNNPYIPFADAIEHFTYTAGRSVQLLHKGPFAGELQTLPILQQFATAKGYKKSGMHHEIHLTQFEKGQSQANLHTILRDPVIKI